RLGAIAKTAAATGLPKLYSPTVSGQPGGPADFHARLTTALPWTITVTDANRNQVGSGSGTHSFVFSADAIADGRYAIVLTASNSRATVTRTVHVTVDRTVSTLVLSPRAVSPNGDGRNDTATLSYALARVAKVHVDLRQSARTIATLL